VYAVYKDIKREGMREKRDREGTREREREKE